MLAQSRGLGVGWTVAHQNFDQLPPELLRSVTANAQNKIYFRLSIDDAARVAKHQSELRPTDLARLPAFEAYAQLLHHDQLTPFASLRTEPLAPSVRDPRRTATLIARRWGPPRHELRAPDPTIDPAAPVGRKPKAQL